MTTTSEGTIHSGDTLDRATNGIVWIGVRRAHTLFVNGDIEQPEVSPLSTCIADSTKTKYLETGKAGAIHGNCAAEDWKVSENTLNPTSLQFAVGSQSGS